MKETPADISVKFGVVEDLKAAKVTKTTKKLNRMRSSLDVEKVKKSTILGQEARIAKLKLKAAEERVRVPEQATEPKIALDEQARTRNQLIQQRKDREFAYNSQNFAKFKSGIHSGKPIPNFYSSV